MAWHSAGSTASAGVSNVLVFESITSHLLVHTARCGKLFREWSTVHLVLTIVGGTHSNAGHSAGWTGWCRLVRATIVVDIDLLAELDHLEEVKVVTRFP